MDVQEQNEREAIEALGHFLTAYGIIQSIRSTDIAVAQDAVEAIAKAYNYDLNTDTDRKKYQESCRKSALNYLRQEGVVEEVENPDGNADPGGEPRYRIVAGKEQDYKDMIYRAAYNAEQTESLAKWMRLCAGIGSIKKTLSIIPSALKLTPEKTITMFGHIVATAQDFFDKAEEINDIPKDLAKQAAEGVSAAVYDNVDRSDDLQKAAGDGKNTLKSIISGIRHRMNRLPISASIQDAHFSKRQEKRINKKLKHSFSSVPKDRRKGWIAMAFSMDTVRKGYQTDIFTAFADLDKKIRPDGPTIKREEVSESVRQDTKFRFGGWLTNLESIRTAAKWVKNEVMDITPGINLLHRVSFLRRHQNIIPEPLYQHYHEHLKQKESLHYEKISEKGFLDKDELGNAMIKIAHFNAINENSERRGENYATEYAKLNLYRCGQSRFLVTSMHLFRMNPLDRVWAMAYMKAGMQETLHGIRFKSYAKDKDGVMHPRSELRREAEEIFHQYTDGKSTREIKSVCEQMEMDFVREHTEMVNRIAVRREEQNLQPLQAITHLNDRLDNAKDPGEKDHLDVAYVNRENVAEMDVEHMQDVDKKDGFAVKGDHSLGLFLFCEDKGVVGITDQNENAVSMKVTGDTYHRSNDSIPLIQEEFDKTQGDLETDLALRYTTYLNGERAGDAIKAKWKPFLSAVIHDGAKVEIDTLLQDGQLVLTDKRTGVEMQVRDDEPNPGFGNVYVARFADEVMKKEYANILSEHGTTDERLQSCTINLDSLNDTQKLVLSHTDKSNELDALRQRLKSYTVDTDPHKVFSQKERGEMLGRMRHDTAPEQVAHFEKLYRDYTEKLQAFEHLAVTDPVLAYCRLEIPQCGRIPGDENKIGVYLKDGSVLAVNEQTLDEQMPERTRTNRDFCHILSNTIEDAHQILAESRENERDFELK